MLIRTAALLKAIIRSSLLLLIMIGMTPCFSAIKYQWEDHFTQQEKKKLVSWISQTTAALEDITGPFSIDVHIYFHRYANASEPVPWAHTQRSRKQGVHFHVNPSFSKKAFLEDWTAPHELSHLVIPYLGSRYSWFAEGFASYLQYQVMERMLVLSKQQMKQRYERNVRRANRGYRFYNRPFVAMASTLKRQGRYPVMYWGGSLYFKQVEHQLEQNHNMKLIDVLKRYQSCCRQNYDYLDNLIQDLNRVSNTIVFSDQLDQFSRKRGFPEFEHVLD